MIIGCVNFVIGKLEGITEIDGLHIFQLFEIQTTVRLDISR